IEELAAELGLTPEACATGILEISAWHQANALRQITVKRGLDVRDFTLTPFGGSGALLPCRLMDSLDIGHVDLPPNPRQLPAVRPPRPRQPLRVRPVVRGRAQRLRAAPDLAARDPRRPRLGESLRRAHRASRPRPEHRGLRSHRAPVRALRGPEIFRPSFRGA